MAVAALVLALLTVPGPALASGAHAGRALASEEPAETAEEPEGSGPMAGLLALGGVALLALVGAVVWSVRRRPPAS